VPQTLRALAFIVACVGAYSLWVLFLGRVPRPASIAVAFALVAAGVYVAWRIERPRELRRLRRERGQCVRCGYDLRGNVSGVCPECGGAT
jgi:DMSO/TMAO reductase YedYZ heme-binding membrane subunit